MAKAMQGWSVVGAVALALMISGTTFAAGGFGVLTAFLIRDYGWTQAQLTPALSIFLLCATTCVPLVGLLVDRFGSRRVALFGIAGLTVTLAAGSLVRSLGEFYLFYAFVGFTGAFTNPIVYLRAITGWFDRHRGLALGLAVAGQGAGGAVLPIFLERTSAAVGWRGCLLIVAVVLAAVIGPAVALLVKDSPAARTSGASDEADDPSAALGFSLKEALGQTNFWLILAVLGLLGATSYAMNANSIYLLTRAQALTLRQAAELQGVGALAMIAGRMVFGWFMDRLHAPRVGVVGVLALAVGAQWLPHLHVFGPAAIGWAVTMGLSGGAETDLLTFLVSRYFGRKALSKIYSWQNVTFLVGAAVGPPAFAVAMARFGTPVPALIGVSALSGLAAGLLLLLGPYPRFAPATTSAARAGTAEIEAAA